MENQERLKQRLPLIQCECGAEILFIPDLKEMNHSIEAHVLEHRRNEKDPAKVAINANRIRDALISQVLRKASEQKK
jgi:hypothetical protein